MIYEDVKSTFVTFDIQEILRRTQQITGLFLTSHCRRKWFDGILHRCFSLFFYNSKVLSVYGNVENNIPLTNTQGHIIFSVPIRMYISKISTVFARVLITNLPPPPSQRGGPEDCFTLLVVLTLCYGRQRKRITQTLSKCIVLLWTLIAKKWLVEQIPDH